MVVWHHNVTNKQMAVLFMTRKSYAAHDAAQGKGRADVCGPTIDRASIAFSIRKNGWNGEKGHVDCQ